MGWLINISWVAWPRVGEWVEHEGTVSESGQTLTGPLAPVNCEI